MPQGLVNPAAFDLPQSIPRRVLLWILFFSICLALGYPTLNRYDPGQMAGTSDAYQYRRMVMGLGSDRVAEGAGALAELGRQENYYRVLVPFVARPVYKVTLGRIGSWDPAFFGLLAANSLFTASIALLLVAIASSLGIDFATAVIGAFIFLLNFCVSNLFLVGLIDSAEAFFLLLIVWSLLKDRWYLLPLCGIFGALAKETFAPLSVLLVAGWWLAEAGRGRRELIRIGWIASLGLAGIATVTAMMSSLAGGLVFPWQFAATMRANASFLAGLRGCLVEHTFWFVFIWLLPLGLVRAGQFPRNWRWAAGVAFCGALFLGAYNNAGGNTTRALFNVAGPLLSLSAAMFLTNCKPARDS